ncbi:hypothetical protein EYR41_006083 [Orbilia oligospora]|uniref:Uncharacterized protein n=1 Tax=Orbilia oligospora TaxID=2813651 RepID=A0A8H2E437_ORBOL|nr:hypothetical protein EYR41_006083 [Orbilia oligospora]
MPSNRFKIITAYVNGKVVKTEEVDFDEASRRVKTGALLFPPRRTSIIPHPSDEAQRAFFEARKSFLAQKDYSSFLNSWIALLNPELSRGDVDIRFFIDDLSTLLANVYQERGSPIVKYLEKSLKGHHLQAYEPPQNLRATTLETELAALRRSLWSSVAKGVKPTPHQRHLFGAYLRWAPYMLVHTVKEDISLLGFLGESSAATHKWPDAINEYGYIKADFDGDAGRWLKKEIEQEVKKTGNEAKVAELNAKEPDSGLVNPYELYVRYQEWKAQKQMAEHCIKLFDAIGDKKEKKNWKLQKGIAEKRLEDPDLWQLCRPSEVLAITDLIDPNSIRSGKARVLKTSNGNTAGPGLQLQPRTPRSARGQNLNQQIQRGYYGTNGTRQVADEASLTNYVSTTSTNFTKKEMPNGDVHYTLDEHFSYADGLNPVAYIPIGEGKKTEKKDIIACIGGKGSQVHRLMSEEKLPVSRKDLEKMINVTTTKRASISKEDQSKTWPQAILGVAFRDGVILRYLEWSTRVCGPQVLNPQLVKQKILSRMTTTYVKISWGADNETWEPASDLHGWKRLGDQRMSAERWREIIYKVAIDMERTADDANGTKYSVDDLSALMAQVKLIDNGRYVPLSKAYQHLQIAASPKSPSFSPSTAASKVYQSPVTRKLPRLFNSPLKSARSLKSGPTRISEPENSGPENSEPEDSEPENSEPENSEPENPEPEVEEPGDAVGDSNENENRSDDGIRRLVGGDSLAIGYRDTVREESSEDDENSGGENSHHRIAYVESEDEAGENNSAVVRHNR